MGGIVMTKFVEKKRTALFGMPLYFTTYTITEEMLNIKKGWGRIASLNSLKLQMKRHQKP